MLNASVFVERSESSWNASEPVVGLQVRMQSVYSSFKAVQNLALSGGDEGASVIKPIRTVIHKDGIL